MKKAMALLALALAFGAVRGSTAEEGRPVLLNGRSFVQAQIVDGTLAVALDQLSKATGSPLQLRELSLHAVLAPDMSRSAVGTAVIGEEGSQVIGEEGSQAIIGEEGSKAIAGEKGKTPARLIMTAIPPGKSIAPSLQLTPLTLAIQRSGQISARVLHRDGVAYVPLRDVVAALGGTYDTSPLPSATEPIRISVTQACKACVLAVR